MSQLLQGLLGRFECFFLPGGGENEGAFVGVSENLRDDTKTAAETILREAFVNLFYVPT